MFCRRLGHLGLLQLQYGHRCHLINFLIKFSNLYDLEDREANISSPLMRPKVARAAVGFFIGQEVWKTNRTKTKSTSSHILSRSRTKLHFCQRCLTLRIFSFAVFQVLDEMVAALKEVQGISRVLYDLTSKPPGTTEWE